MKVGISFYEFTSKMEWCVYYLNGEKVLPGDIIIEGENYQIDYV